MSLPQISVFFLFILIVVNKIANRVLSKKLFSRSELLMIYVIISTTLAFTAHDNMVCLMGVLPHSTFFATAENDWINLFISIYQIGWLFVMTKPSIIFIKVNQHSGQQVFTSSGLSRLLRGLF